MTSTPDVSIVLTAHHEGRGIIPTLRALQRCARHAAEAGVVAELVIVQDAASAATTDIIARCLSDGTLSALRVTTTSTDHADPGPARTHGIAAARADLVMVVEADDLPSAPWLAAAVATARTHPGPVVLHPELVVTFGESFEAWPVLGSDDPGFHPGWLAWYNAWPSLCLAPRAVFEATPHRPSGPGGGFGPEDWAWNCDTLAAGVPHRTVPGTALFSFAHDWGALAALHRPALLPANDLLTDRTLAEAEVARLTALLAAREDEARREEERREQERRDEERRRADEQERLAAERRAAESRWGRTKTVVRAVRALVRSPRPATEGDAPGPEPQPSPQEERPPSVEPLVPAFTDPGFLAEWAALHRIQPHLPHPSEANLARYRRWGDTWDDEFVHDRLAYWTGISELPTDPDVLFITPWLRTGGADVLTVQYVHAIRATRPGATIGLVTTGAEPSTRLGELGSDVTVNWLGRFALAQPWSSRVLGMLLTQLRPQTVHLVNSYEGIEACDRYARSVTAHSAVFISTFVLDAMEDGSWWSHLHHRSRDFFDGVAGILVDSRHFAEEMAYAEGIPADTFVVHHQAVDEELRPRAARTFSAEAPARVLWAGRFDLQKRLDRLAAIAERTRERGLPVAFTALGEPVIGDDPHTPDHLRRLADAGVTVGPPYVGGFGAVGPERYDAFLLTSDREGVPNTLLEAMASGLPVIAPDVGGVGEAVSDQTGYLIPDAGDVVAYVDALAALTTDPADALLRAQRAREQIERDYSFDGLCATLESIDSYLPRAVSPAR